MLSRAKLKIFFNQDLMNLDSKLTIIEQIFDLLG